MAFVAASWEAILLPACHRALKAYYDEARTQLAEPAGILIAGNLGLNSGKADTMAFRQQMTCVQNNSACIFASKPFEKEGIDLLLDDEPSVSSVQFPMQERYVNAPWNQKARHPTTAC